MTRRYYEMALIIFSILCFLFIIGLIYVPFARAASLRICWEEMTADVVGVPAFFNDDPVYENLLVDSTLSGASRCSVRPIPASLVKGKDFIVTLKAVNAVGEVSGPSNGMPFRNPASPPIPTLHSVEIVAP